LTPTAIFYSYCLQLTSVVNDLGHSVGEDLADNRVNKTIHLNRR
jgi:hypothetical protein